MTIRIEITDLSTTNQDHLKLIAEMLLKLSDSNVVPNVDNTTQDKIKPKNAPKTKRITAPSTPAESVIPVMELESVIPIAPIPTIPMPIIEEPKAPTTFPELMEKITSAVFANKLKSHRANEIAKSLGLERLQLLSVRPDLIPQMELLIDAEIM